MLSLEYTHRETHSVTSMSHRIIAIQRRLSALRACASDQ